MISLAILACIVLLFTLLSGPLVYLISKIGFIPKTIKKILAVLCILTSIYLMIVIPLPIVQVFCFISIVFAYASLKKK
jgi:hypothetical protein